MRKEAMNCKDTGELLTAYLDGEVTEKEKALVESHLPDCPRCKTELEALKATQASLRGVLTSMAEEVAPSTEAWQKVRAKIEKKDGWLEGLVKMLTSQKWQGAVVTAAVVVVAVSAAIWQISGAGQPSLVTAPRGVFDVPTAVPAPTPTAPTTPPPPAQVTVTVPSVTVPAPSPAPATPPPQVTPPPTAIPPPTVTVQAPPPAAVVIQPPPPAQVTVNSPAVTVQAPPPAQVTVNVPESNALYPASLLYWLLLPIGLGIVLLLVCIWPKQKRK